MTDLESRIRTEEFVEEELQAKREELLRGLKRVAQAREGQMASRNMLDKHVGHRMRQLSNQTGASISELDEIGYTERRLTKLHNEGWRLVVEPGPMNWQRFHKPEYVYGPAKRKPGQINQDQGSWVGGAKNALGGCFFILVVASIIVTIGGALIVAAPVILGFLLALGILVYILAAAFG